MPRTATIFATEELLDLLGCTKQNLSRIAREQGWTRVTGYTGDIAEYLWARWRRDLAREMGVTVPGLVAHDEWDKDDNCPVCGGFAIYRPATGDEIKNFAIDVYGEGWPWLCINGHNEKDKDEEYTKNKP